MFDLGILLLLAASLITLIDWRKGLLVMVVMIIAQDAVRKTLPDQPIVFVVFAAIVYFSACAGALTRGVSLNPTGISGWRRFLATPINVFIAVVAFQALQSYSNFNSVALAIFGTAKYLAPLLAMTFSYRIAADQGDKGILLFLLWYCLCTFPALATVYLESIDVNWQILGSVGPGLFVYDRVLGIVKANSGIYRASEIAAWHAATCACFVFIALTFRKFNIMRIVVGAGLIAILLFIGALTGRLKMVVHVAIFFISYFALWALFARSAFRVAMALTLVGVLGFAALVAGTEVDAPERMERSVGYDVYVRRTQTVFEDIPKRFVELGIAPVLGIFDSFGFFGAGVGVATQGVQNFIDRSVAFSHGNFWLIAGAGEGGLGKILVELGMVGFIVIIWVCIAGVRHIWSIVRNVSTQSPELGRLCFGLFSFLIANVAAFTVATQAFGDPSILIILSVALGFMLAIPVLGTQSVQQRSVVMAPQPVPAEAKT